jgi:hypothetical protein
MLFSNNCRFVLFFFLSVSANAETIRDGHRELDAATVSARPATILAKTGISTVPTSAILATSAARPSPRPP